LFTIISPFVVLGDKASNASVFVVCHVPQLDIRSVHVTHVVNGRPVAFVSVQLVGVPNTGVTNVGDVPKTNAPVPVSSDITHASSDDVVAHTFVLFNAPIAILAVQSKEVQPIVLAVSSAVAVPAFHVIVV
jgi:hypothetical protein